VSPTVNVDVIRLCQRYDKLVMPGAFTPTEILRGVGSGCGQSSRYFPRTWWGLAFFKAVARTAAADSPDADRRRRSDHGGPRFSKRARVAWASAGNSLEPKAVAERNFSRISATLAKQYVAAVASRAEKSLSHREHRGHRAVFNFKAPSASAGVFAAQPRAGAWGFDGRKLAMLCISRAPYILPFFSVSSVPSVAFLILEITYERR